MPRLLYCLWTPTTIQLARQDRGLLVTEPAEIAVTADNKISGLGRGAREAVKARGDRLVVMGSWVAFESEPKLARNFFRFYWSTAEWDGRSSWWCLVSGLISAMESDVVIHLDTALANTATPDRLRTLQGAFVDFTQHRRIYPWAGPLPETTTIHPGSFREGRWLAKPPWWAAA